MRKDNVHCHFSKASFKNYFGFTQRPRAQSSQAKGSTVGTCDQTEELEPSVSMVCGVFIPCTWLWGLLWGNWFGLWPTPCDYSSWGESEKLTIFLLYQERHFSDPISTDVVSIIPVPFLLNSKEVYASPKRSILIQNKFDTVIVACARLWRLSRDSPKLGVWLKHYHTMPWVQSPRTVQQGRKG